MMQPGAGVGPPAAQQYPQQAQQPYMMMPPPQQQAGQAPPIWAGAGQVAPPPPQQQQAPPLAQPATADEVRTLWIGDLQFWMDENYLFGCFAHSGEVATLNT